MKKIILLCLFCITCAGIYGTYIAIGIGPEKHILSEKDFKSTGLMVQDQSEKQSVFTVSINYALPVYTFHVVSFSNTMSGGYIEVFKEHDFTPMQIIQLDPNMWLSGQVHLSFTVQDINFDGISDIGVVVDGGALWVSYQYWIFDNESGMFITAPVTEDFRNISFQNIMFDTHKKQVIAYGLIGAIGRYKHTYQFENGRLLLVEEIMYEQIMVEDGSIYTQNNRIQCHVTLNTYHNNEVLKTIKVLSHECPSVSPETV